MWAAVAIHDTSSVIGATARFGAEALQIATTVKLARALWIVPLTIATAFVFKKHVGRTLSPSADSPSAEGLENPSHIAMPWFILFFLLASVIRTYATGPWEAIVYVARVGLTVTLFLIGASLSRQSIAAVGVRPMLLGVILWIVISTTSLFAVLRFIPSR